MANLSSAFWNFLEFFPPNIFSPWLIKFVDAEPVDTEGQLYCINVTPSLKQVNHATHQSAHPPGFPAAAVFHPHSAVF